MIKIDNCTKIYVSRDGTSRVKALDCIDLTIKDKEFVALLGPSGCGKTTLLKIIAGLIAWNEGTVTVNGQVVDGPGPDRAGPVDIHAGASYIKR